VLILLYLYNTYNEPVRTGECCLQLSKKGENLLLIIWVQALLATGGSLYYSEILDYPPCELCWFQRIFMYPLVIIYGTALIKKDIRIALSGVFLSGVGLCISIYHYALQKVPQLQDNGGFCGDVPCTLQYANYFGFVTIPFLAGIAFIIIFVCHLILLKEGKKHEK